jgi:hypothetical protein
LGAAWLRDALRGRMVRLGAIRGLRLRVKAGFEALGERAGKIEPGSPPCTLLISPISDRILVRRFPPACALPVETSMSLQTQLVIPVPAAAAWHLLIDTTLWPRWGPSVRAVDVPARCIGPSMRGRVQTPAGLWLPFQISEWDEGRLWVWRVAGLPATGHRVEPLAPASCCVTFTVPIWAPLYLPVCRIALRRLSTLAGTAAGSR